MATSREQAQKQRAQARQQRREKAAETERLAGDRPVQEDVAEKTRAAGSKARDMGSRVLEAGGKARDVTREKAEAGAQRATPKTMATAAAVGASLGAAALAGKKLLSSKDGGKDE